MEWLIVLMLILIGAILMMMEFLVFPGVNVAGILGFVCILAGLYSGYAFYGTPGGHIVLLGTGVFGGGLTWYVLRSKTWKRLSLESRIDATVDGVDEAVREGDYGETLGRLAPMGNVRVGECVAEAESRSGYIDAHRKVKVVKVLRNRIIVETVAEQAG